MTQKGFVPIILLVGVLVIIIVSSGAYYLGRSSSKSDTQENKNINLKVIQPDQSATPKVNTQAPSNIRIVIPSDWSYKANIDCDVDFPIPPKKEPYFNIPNPNRAPSVTYDEASGRFWDYPRGVFYPNLLLKLYDNKEQYKQIATTYASEDEASGYVSAAVVVSCLWNTRGINNKQLLDLLKVGLQKYNQTNTETMEASKYTIDSSENKEKWGQDIISLTVSEYFKNSGGEPYTNSVNYVMFATKNKIYEVRKIVNSDSSFVKDTAQKIFDNLKFTSN